MKTETDLAGAYQSWAATADALREEVIGFFHMVPLSRRAFYAEQIRMLSAEAVNFRRRAADIEKRALDLPKPA